MVGPNLNRAARGILIGAGLTILLGLVAVATHSGFGHTGHHAVASHALISYGLTVFMILFVASIPIAMYMRIQQFDPDSVAAGRGLRRYIRGLLSIAFVLAAAYFVHLLWRHLHIQHHRPLGVNNPSQNAHVKNGASGHAATSPTFEYPVLWAALAFLLVAVAIGALRARKRAPLPLRDLPFEDDVAATIEGAIEELEREPDARRAVIAAYARMEAVLGRHGLARKLSETPIEYLRRVLLGLTAHGDAVTRLTGLFERAKFSTHEIDANAKQDAIGSLREIREGMA